MSSEGEKGEGGYIEISDGYLLGADELGRDLLSRIICGRRISIAVALFLAMFAFNFLGDGLRDALDPTLQGRE